MPRLSCFVMMGPGKSEAAIAATCPALGISLDFELAWGMETAQALHGYRANIEGARIAIPKMLDLFGRYNVINCTWATVGLPLLLTEGTRCLTICLAFGPNIVSPDFRPMNGFPILVATRLRIHCISGCRSYARSATARDRKSPATLSRTTTALEDGTGRPTLPCRPARRSSGGVPHRGAPQEPRLPAQSSSRELPASLPGSGI